MPFTSATPLVPHFDVTVHIVLDDFGRAGRVYRETDERQTSLESVVDDLLTGQFSARAACSIRPGERSLSAGRIYLDSSPPISSPSAPCAPSKVAGASFLSGAVFARGTVLVIRRANSMGKLRVGLQMV